MQMWRIKRQNMIANIMWFVASLMMAIIVWLTANLNSNPFLQRGFRDPLPVEILLPENTIMTTVPTQRAYVIVRAQESVFEQLASEDIQVFADLSDIEVLGRITVPLQATIAEERRASVVTLSPSQITVELEQLEERFIPLNLNVTGEVPVSMEATSPTTNVTQILVSGPANTVRQVASAQVTVDLEGQREPLDVELRPVVLNTDGEPIEKDITLSPDIVGVTVQVQPRSDVREVRVTPNLIGEPPAGYTLTPDFNYTPETVFVSGTPEVLEALQGGFLTAPIDLSVYTNDFEIRVPVELPSDDLVLITGQRVTVTVGIDPIQSSRQFEGIVVELIGLQGGLSATVAPEVVTVLINGPQPVLDELVADDLRVIVDVNDITEAGVHQLQPVGSITTASLETENISVLPSTIDITVTDRADGS